MGIIADLMRGKDNGEVPSRIVYAVSDAVTPGKVLVFSETVYCCEYIVFHSEDEARYIASEVDVPLVHLRDVPLKVPPIQETVELSPDLARHYERLLRN